MDLQSYAPHFPGMFGEPISMSFSDAMLPSYVAMAEVSCLEDPLRFLKKSVCFFYCHHWSSNRNAVFKSRAANFIWCFTWSWRSSNQTTTFQQVLRRGDRGISPVVAGGTWQTSKSFSFISLPSPGLNFCGWWYPYPVRNYVFTTKKNITLRNQLT